MKSPYSITLRGIEILTNYPVIPVPEVNKPLRLAYLQHANSMLTLGLRIDQQYRGSHTG